MTYVNRSNKNECLVQRLEWKEPMEQSQSGPRLTLKDQDRTNLIDLEPGEYMVTKFLKSPSSGVYDFLYQKCSTKLRYLETQRQIDQDLKSVSDAIEKEV